MLTSDQEKLQVLSAYIKILKDDNVELVKKSKNDLSFLKEMSVLFDKAEKDQVSFEMIKIRVNDWIFELEKLTTKEVV